MTYQGVAERSCAYPRRRIRWDRVLACALVAVVITWKVHAMVSNPKDSHSEGTSGVVGGNSPSSTTATDYMAFTTTSTTTTETTKNVVVPNFELKLKSSPEAMGISGIYWSSKLQRIISVRDQQILAMLVLAEGAYEPFDTQVGIANTVLNRVLSEKYPDDIEDVVVQPQQFSPVIMRNGINWNDEGWNGFYNNNGKVEVIWTNYPEEVRTSVLQAVYSALDGTDSTACVGGALYYCNMNQLSDYELKYRESIGETVTYGRTTFYRDWN